MLFVLCLTHLLASITQLASHPTESNYYLWQRNLDPYGITQRSYNGTRLSNRNHQEIEGQISDQSPVESDRRETRPLVPDVRHHQIERLRSNERNPHFQLPTTGFQVHSRPEFRQIDEPMHGHNVESIHSLGDDAVGGDEDFNVTTPCRIPLFVSTYSSHVDCATQSQNDEKTESMSVAMEKDAENLGSTVSQYNEKETNIQHSARDFRRGPMIRGTTILDIISTTEKIFRNPTIKGNKRQRPRPSASKPQSSQIVFPDGYRNQKFIPRATKCGKKTTFCEHIGEEYPSEYINQVLKREGAMFREFFGRDVISDPNITERIHAPEENSLCPFRQEVVYPRAAKNKEDKWLFVVNQDQYVQGVTVEVCLNPESRCILTEGFPLGYTPYCKQKYIERRLVAIGEDGKPHSDSFRLPSCCSCVVKHDTSSRAAPLRVSRDAGSTTETKPSETSRKPS